MTNLIIEIIEHQSESHIVAFKKEQYNLGKHPKKNEILKDILAFANQTSDEDKFIIVGVKEIDSLSKEISHIESLIDDANYQQFVLENLEPKINFEYKAMTYENKTIAYFRIFNNKDRPYLFKREVVNSETSKIHHKYGDGYIRIGTTTKKIGRKELNDIEKIQNKSFDRRNDITIVPIIANRIDEELDTLDRFNIKYLDIEIINNSTKSIDIDVEMKFFKGNGFLLISEFDFQKEQDEEIRKNRKSLLLQQTNFDSIHARNLGINISQNESEIIISRYPIKTRTAIILAQNSCEKDVFFKKYCFNTIQFK